MADSVKIRIEGDDAPFQKTLSGLGKVAGTAFKGLATGVTAVSAAASAAGLAAIKAGSDFTASMSEVQAISGATAEEFQLLEQTAKQYGASTMFSASQAADALKYMALAGWDAQKSVDALPGVLNLAAASGMELGAASDMVTDYLSAFGMEASKAGYFSDLLAHAQSSSNTTAAALGEAYRNCAANLNAAGQDVETVTAALMGMANQGLKGSVAGTAMAAIMRDIGNQMQNGAIQIGKTSVAVQDAEGNYRDLTDIMIDVQAATEGMGTAERTAALSSTFTADSIRGVNMILQEGAENIAAYEEGLRGASGAAEDMAGTMMDNLQGDITMFKSALEGLQITAFEGMEGPARSMVQMATDAIGQMNTAYQKNGMDGLVNNISSQIPKLTALGAEAASKLMGGVAKKMPGMVKNLLSALPSVLGSAIDLAPQLADSLFSLTSTAIETLISQLPTLAPMIGKGLLSMFTSAARGLGSLVSSVFSGIWTAMGDLGLRDLTLEESIQKQIDGLATFVNNMIMGLNWDEEGHVITPPLTVEPQPEAAPNTQEKIEDTVEEAASETGEPATSEPEIFVQPVITPAEDVQEEIAQVAGQAAEAPAEPAPVSVPVTAEPQVMVVEDSGIQDAVTAQLQSQTMAVSVKANVSLQVSVSDSNASAIGQGAGQEVSAGIASGISSGAGQVQSAARSVVNSGAITARGAANLARSAGLSFSNGLAAGIRSGQSSITAAARAVAAAAAAAARSALSIHSPSKVTEELGRFFDMGFVRGMDRHAPLVSKSAANVAQVAASAIDGIVGAANFNPRFNSGAFLNDLSGTLTDATQDFAAAESGRPIVLSVNGRELGRVMATDNAQALGERSRRRAVGLGVR